MGYHERMRKKAVVIAVVVLGALAVTAGAMTRMAPPAIAPSPQEKRATTSSAAKEPVLQAAYAWEFELVGEDEFGAPLSRVSLVADGKRYDAGTHQGSCRVRAEDFLPGEKSAAVCWFAGGGVELGVFEENGARVMKTGLLDEGSAETDGFRGDFVTRFKL